MRNPSWKGQPVFLLLIRTAALRLTSYRYAGAEIAPKAGNWGLAFCKKIGRVDFERSGDAFEKVEGGCELCVLDLAHMAAAYVGPMSKLFLAEAAGASQVLDVQCYTVPQVHARDTDTVREISPRDICYI